MKNLQNLSVKSLLLNRKDPRFFQIVFLSSFVLIGVLSKDLYLPVYTFLLCLISASFSQVIFERLFCAEKPSFLSAWITALSICLLIRSNVIWPYMALPALAIASKFLIRYQKHHVFNPANFAIVIALLFFSPVWISDAFWGNALSLSVWLMFLGLWVTQKTKVSLPSFAFLLCYFSLTAIKTLYLGFEFLVWKHEFQSGALMIFTFFMLSDPRTSPSQAKHQWLYAFLIASIAFTMKHLLFINDAFFYSLAISCMVMNVLIKSTRTFQWID